MYAENNAKKEISIFLIAFFYFINNKNKIKQHQFKSKAVTYLNSLVHMLNYLIVCGYTLDN